MQKITLNQVSRFIDLKNSRNMEILSADLQEHITYNCMGWSYNVSKDTVTVEAEEIKYLDELLHYGITEDLEYV